MAMDRSAQMLALVIMALYGFVLGAGLVGLIWWLT